ncbi:hypothetical protein IEQ44_02605 [Nocardioides sp. Y6]|uniref:Uncharacterized protein n=1 Tax=Nocardioides malaquae TaxID=2773426 RepID=A0ABR9RPP9_9ACTN|nr:hypothetical protein [Nocardioides malaquae]MBE7323544.1 hypothetical protein [Nocardioides malaquae]
MRSALHLGHFLLVVAVVLAGFDLLSGRDGLNPLMVALLVAGGSLTIAESRGGGRGA